jgi:hypothetical protein
MQIFSFQGLCESGLFENTQVQEVVEEKKSAKVDYF